MMDAHPDDVRDALSLSALVRSEGGAEQDDEPDPVAICERLGIHVYEVPRSRLGGGTAGALTWQRGGFTIEVDESLELAAMQGTIAHELGHAACKLWGVAPHAWERFAWLFAGALLIPDSSLEYTWRESGRDLGAFVERWSHVPPTLAALRLGEGAIADVHVVQDYGVRYSRGRAPADDVLNLGVHAWIHGRAWNDNAHAVRLVDARRRAAVLFAA